MTLRFQFLLGSGLIGILVIAAFSYRPGLAGPFVLDDLTNIKYAQVESLDREDWVRATFSNYSSPLGRPVAAATFAATTFAYGLHPWGFKYQNLMLHLMCGLLLFVLSARLLGHALPADKARQAWLIAGIGASLWLLHPLHVSTTLYPVQRMAQLATLFVLIGLLAYAVLRVRLSRWPRTSFWLLAATTTTSGLLGILSKENAALLVLYLPLVETAFFRWRTESAVERRYLFLYHALFAMLPLALGLIYFATQTDQFLGNYIKRDFNLGERLLTESRVLFHYISLLLVPDLSRMTLFYDSYPIQRTLDWSTMASIAGHAALLLGALASLVRTPVLGFGITFFYAAHLLESTILPLEPVFEHRNYLAAWGLLLPASYYGTRAICRLSRAATIRWLAIGSVLLGCAYMTHVRAWHWGDEERLYRYSYAKRPDSVRVITFLGDMHMRRGHPERARDMLRDAVAIAPKDAGPALHLLHSYCGTTSVPPQNVEESRKRLEQYPVRAYARNRLNKLVAANVGGQCPAIDNGELLTILQAALDNADNTGWARYALLVLRGQVLMHDNQHRAAIATYGAANALRHHAPYPHKTYALEGLTISQLAIRDPGAKASIAELLRLTEDPRINASESTRPLLDALREGKPVSLRVNARGNANSGKPANKALSKGQ